MAATWGWPPGSRTAGATSGSPCATPGSASRPRTRRNCFGNSCSATLLAEQPAPGLVLLDIQLPGRDGFGVLADVQTIEGDHPWKVVALTAHAMPGDRERALDAGFDGYITKPIDVRTFAAEVTRYLSSAGSSSAD